MAVLFVLCPCIYICTADADRHCATKSVILHLQWQEGEGETEGGPVSALEKLEQEVMSPTPLPAAKPRARTTSTHGGGPVSSPRGGAPGSSS
jgi:hypothetical protein